MEWNKDIVAAEYDYEIQLKKNTQALEARAQAVNDAKEALQTHFAKENNISDRIYTLRQDIAKLEEEQSHVRSSDLKTYEKYTKKIKELNDQKTKLEKEYNNEVERRNALKQNIITAEQEYANQEKENQIAEAQASNKLAEAKEKRAKQIEEEAAKAKEELQKEKNEKDRELNKAKADVKSAETDFKNAVKNYQDARDNFMGNNMNFIDQALRNMDRSGMINSQNLQNPTVSYRDANGNAKVGKAQDVVAQYALEQGLANGSIRNSRDANRAMRDAARAYRDAASSQEANQERRDANRLNQLRNKNPRAMSPREKKELENLEALDDAKKKAANDAEKAAKDAKAAQDKQAKAAEAVIKIEEELKEIKEKLGLK